MDRESRPSKPVTRRVADEPIDLEIDAHLERRWINDAAQASHDGVVGGERTLDMLSSRRRLNADRLLSVWIGDAQREHAAPVGPGSEAADDAALSQRVVGRVEIEVAVERPASDVGGNPAGQRP
jgi:hypothetical protein